MVIRNATGVAYFDDVQLEEGNETNNVNLVENSDLTQVSSSNKRLPNKWSHLNLDLSDKCDGIQAETKDDKGYPFTIYGDTSLNKYLTQSIPVGGTENDTYFVSALACADSCCDTNSNIGFDICIKVLYTDGTYVWKRKVDFNRRITDWQYGAETFDLSDGTSTNKTPKSVGIYLRYWNQVNSAQFKNIQLLKCNSKTYTYDSNGNRINSSKSTSQKTTNTYNGSNLTKSVDANGYITTYAYDGYHNITSQTSQNGVINKNTYNTQGLVSNSKIANNMALTSENKYSSADTTNGISENAYLTETIDNDGNSIKYNHNTLNGKLNYIENAQGIKTNYTYNSNGRMNSISTDGTTNSITYKNGKVATLKSSNDSHSETYHFGYDNFGNKSQTKIGDNVLSTNIYNDFTGTLTKSTLGNNYYEEYDYNDFNQLTTIKQNGNDAYSFAYDNKGNLKSKIDSINNLSCNYMYDTIGRKTVQYIKNTDNNSLMYSNEFGYDLNDNICKIVNSAGGNDFTQQYTYGKDNLITRHTMTVLKYIDYAYDSLNRLSNKSFHFTDSKSINTRYNYYISNKNTDGSDFLRTTKIKREVIGDRAYRYSYDSLGNITKIDQGVRVDDSNEKDYETKISYTYDNIGEITRENNKYINQTIIYNYDGLGNITSKAIYPYIIGTIDSEPIKTINYTYYNDDWHDLLHEYDGMYINYDSIGNPTTYCGSTMTWNGRELSSISKNDDKISYTYDSDGLRASKDVNGTKSTFEYVNGNLLYEKRGNAKLYFWYDSNNNLSEVCYINSGGTGQAYYAMCNSRGDVEDLYDSSGNLAVHYTYDTWGKMISVTDKNGKVITDKNNIGNINPIRYRSCYYDTETGYYYLQSRYYNPEVGRFLNADVYATTGDSVIATNTFAYCSNNPVMFSDYNGNASSCDMHLAMPILQGLVGALQLQGLDDGLKIIGINLNELMQTSINHNWFGVFKELCLTTLTVINVASSSFSRDRVTTNGLKYCGNKYLDICAKEVADTSYNITGVLKGARAVLSVIEFVDEIDNSGNALTRGEYLAMAITNLAVSLAGDFLGPIGSVVSSYAVSISTKTLLLRKHGCIFDY